MNSMVYLFMALTVIWAGVLGYILRLGGLRKQLEEKVERINDRLERNEQRYG